MKYKCVDNIVVLKFVFLSLVFLFLSCSSSKLKVDKNLVSGHLENGLKYYIYGNQIPSKAVHMGILFNVGSLNEDENERGLAHYLEHMAFKGTKDYPGSESIIEVFKKFGIKFGADINAYTSFDQTYYHLDLTDGGNESEIDEALNVLRNWAFQIEFDEVEINKERNVILEEKKRRENYAGRLNEKMFGVLFKNSKYAVRFPIGLEERIMSFKSEDFKKFYKKWYRPDLISIIIVGDIAPDEVEKKVRERFSSLEKPVTGPEKVKINLDTTIDEKFVSIEDIETPLPSMNFVVKKKLETVFGTVDDIKRLVEQTLLDELFVNRFYELKTAGTNDFISFNKFDAQFKSDDSYVLMNEISFKINPEHFRETIEGFFYEIERIKRFGFTKGEIDKVKSKIISSAKIGKDNIGKRSSSSIVDNLVDVVSKGAWMFDMNEYFDIILDHINKISLNKISELSKKEASIDDMSVIYLYSEKSHPNLTFEKMIELRDLALKREMKPYEGVLIQDEFFKESLESKAIIDEKELFNGISCFMLENGVEVYFKHNEHKQNLVSFSASSWGGLLSENAELIPVLSLAPRIISNSGYGAYSKLQVEKYLSDKVVSLIPTVGDQMSSINGSSETKDLETLFKLIYFTFNDPKVDDVVLQNIIDDVKAGIKSRENNAKHLFYSAIDRFCNNDDYRLREIEESDLKNISKDVLLDFYKKRFTYADNFKFVFVGDVDLETIKNLSSKYLGNLKSKRLDEFRDLDYSYSKSTDRVVIRKGEASSSTVSILYPFKFSYTPEDVLNYEALASLLTDDLIKTVRREMSSVYSIGASFDSLFRKYSNSDGLMNIYFTVEPKVLDDVLKAVNKYILEKQKSDFLDKDFDYVKKNIIKNNNILAESNGYWLSNILYSVLWYGDLRDTFSDKFIEASLSKDVINRLSKKIDFKHGVEIVLIPEKGN
ncbi:insulinase family protein [Borrelia coriaceae]|uniref:Peptidase, M16 family protein n=1 Tax=Borrelia coriaceae ATCC 43381 TaxID=1408429 RepID=W5T083_9SPIR|nr:insulinase family protein [Borrelia coriaceae]AHH10716.1 Peptidase, M16 family protein [Borrelia coriaceae ATCC 43381]UPA16388.1 insulinase family protein [Borrelia coriaceae]